MKNSSKDTKPTKGQRLGWAPLKDSVSIKLDTVTIKSRSVNVTGRVVATNAATQKVTLLVP